MVRRLFYWPLSALMFNLVKFDAVQNDILNLKIIAVLLVVIISNSGVNAQNVVVNYIQKYQHIAKPLSDSFGVPVDLIIAIAIVESAAGTSRNSIVLNNHFGLKAGSKLRTVKGIKTRFRDYQNDTLGYMDFCTYLSKRKFYAQLKGNFDYNAWLNAMAKSGYSAKPIPWKTKIISYIKKHNLTALNGINATTKQP